MTDANLTITEAFLLLSLRDQDGKPLIGSTDAGTAVAGALLTDLVIAGRIDIDDDRVRCADPAPTGDPELDAAHHRIAGEKKKHKAKWWVSKLRSKGLRQRLLARPAERGVLREEHGRALGLFPVTRHAEQDPSPEQKYGPPCARPSRAVPAGEAVRKVIAQVHAVTTATIVAASSATAASALDAHASRLMAPDGLRGR